MLSRRKDIDDSDVWFMYEHEDMTQQEIADYYGVSRQCIQGRLYPEKMKEYSAKWYLKNSEKIKDCSKQYRLEHPEYNKEWQLEHPEYNKEYYKNHSDDIKEYQKIFREEHPECLSNNRKEWWRTKIRRYMKS